jgi:tRNA(Arg) A34 adenosine deaminase TadA
MRLAIDQGQIAVRDGNTPYGAVIVDPDGEIAAVARNQTVEHHDSSSHAEMLAIRDVCRERRTFSLEGYRIYASGQPCPMCSAAIIRTGITECYYAAPADRASAMILTEELAERAGPGATRVIGGVLEDEAVAMMARLTADEPVSWRRSYDTSNLR